jgi:hypothetical protein
MHVRVFQNPCALGNLLVVCQSRLFHSNVDLVWDLGAECFHVFYVGYGEDLYVEGSPLINYIEKNRKRPVVFMRARSKQFDP